MATWVPSVPVELEISGSEVVSSGNSQAIVMGRDS